MPEERRVALDLLDVRESIEEMGDKIRWIPTDHMLVDCLTKAMPPDVMLEYLRTTEYAFKYDDVLKNTKRAQAKVRKEARLKKIGDNKASKDTTDQVLYVVPRFPTTPMINCRTMMETMRMLGKSYRATYLKTVESLFGEDLKAMPQELYGKLLLKIFA